MDSIPNDNGHIASEFGNVRRDILEALSTVFIRLDSRNVSVWQRDYNRFQFRDVFLGPFNFQLGSGETVEHKPDFTKDSLG
jgi:hypothetical protein